MANLKIIVKGETVPTTPCGGNVNYDGGQSFPSEKIISLGSGVGSFLTTCNARSVPDKFMFYLDGVLILDTGYLGNETNQNALNIELANRGLPPEQIVPNSANVDYANTLQKTQPGNQNLTVKVFAPLPGTAWSFYVGCPTSTGQAQETPPDNSNVVEE